MNALLFVAPASQAAVEYAVLTAGRALESALVFATKVADVASDHWGAITIGLVVLVLFALFKNISSPNAR